MADGEDRALPAGNGAFDARLATRAPRGAAAGAAKEFALARPLHG